jgi:predicted Zn-dependent protease
LVVCANGLSQSPRERPLGQWTNVAEEMFDRFMVPTEGEQQRLEEVEVDFEEENKVGEQMRDDFFQQSRLIVKTHGRDADYLSALAGQIKPLMANADRYEKIQVYVAKSEATDARAFPGGHVVFTIGMLDYAQSEAEVVGILAHELSHIDREHQLERLRTTKLAEATFHGDHISWHEMATSGQMLAKQFGRPYRPDQEEQADLDAAAWLFELGYDPREMANLFARFGKRDRVKVFPMPQFVRSHPYYADRQLAVSRVYDELREKHPDRVLYVGQQNLRQRIPRSERAFRE